MAKESLGIQLKEEKTKFENINKVKIEMEQELDTLRQLKDQLKSSQQSKSDLESKLNKLEANIQDKDQMFESLKTQKDSLENNLNELRTKSSDSNAQVDALNLDLKSKSEELQASQDALASLKSDLNALKDNNEILRAKTNEDLTTPLQESKTQVQDLQDLLKKKESELIEVSKSLSEIKSCYHATEQDLKSLRQDKSNLEEELEEVKRYTIHVAIFTIFSNIKNFVKLFEN